VTHHSVGQLEKITEKEIIEIIGIHIELLIDFLPFGNDWFVVYTKG
jgi:hypothetical protein